MKKILIMLLCLCLLMTLIPLLAYRPHADGGDYGGDADFGGDDGGGYDGGGGGDDNWGGGDDDYSYDSSTSSSNSNFNLYETVAFWTLIGIIIAAYFVNKYKKNSGKSVAGGGATPIDKSKLSPIGDYLSEDPGFDERALCDRISNFYVQFQNCWTAKDIEPLRPYLTDTLWSQFDRQLDFKRKNHQTNYVERIAVMGVTMCGWYTSGNDDRMVATVKSRIVDYTVNDSDGTVISGSKTAEKFMTYEYELSRKHGTRTEKAAEVKTVNCPNCGAVVEINESAKCPYCGSVITLDSHDWVIASIKGISQKTVNR